MRLPLAINAVLAIVALCLAFAAPGEGALRLASATGAVQLSNSSDGRAVFNAADMRPGGEIRGTVTIGNPGTTAAAVQLSRVPENETPGLGGGLLSQQLVLQVLDVTVATSPVALYNGPLNGMPALSAGRFGPSQSRTFAFIATLPAEAADNAYQGAELSSGFAWDATADDEPVPTASPVPPAATPAPTATAQPTAAPAPTPAGAAAPDTDANTGAVAADEVLNLPDARRCVSRRKFKIHLRRPHGFVLSSLVITVNKRVKVRLRGAKARRAKATLSLRGLPAGKVRVKIVATFTKGAKLVSKRTYRTCTKKKKAARKKRRHGAKKR